MKTTKKDFILFKAECRKWIEVFGLKGWSVEFRHDNSIKDSTASRESNLVNRWAILRLNTTWDDLWEITNESIQKSAYHEVMELFLNKIRVLAEYRYSTEAEIDEEVHAIIRTLENVVFK